jgi:hypothetical protein
LDWEKSLLFQDLRILDSNALQQEKIEPV